jgi:anti-sigma factor RsiW
MGDCDRLKKHISDYLEGGLDPTTRKQFEEELRTNPELQQLTNQVQHVSKMLSDLPRHKCKDDFNVRLRERIHSESTNSKFNVNIRRYSLAFSFVVIVGIAIFGINGILKDDTRLPAAPPSNAVSVEKSIPENEEFDVKTRDPQTAATDSIKDQKDPRIKYVDQKK